MAGGIIDQQTLKQRSECVQVRGRIHGILTKTCGSRVNQTLSIESLMEILVPGIGDENGRNTIGGDFGDGIRARSGNRQISSSPSQPHALKKLDDRCLNTG